MFLSPAFIKDAFRIGSVLLLGSTGEIISEKSGHLNLGTPGIMAVGGISGIAGAYLYGQSVSEIKASAAIIITFIAALVGSLIASLIYAFLTITLKANQNVTGLALTTFGTGISNFLGGVINKANGSGSVTSSFSEFGKLYQKPLPLNEKLGAFGDAVMELGFISYLAVVIALVAAFILFKTRVGLNLRAVGENPATADAAGINITKYKYFSVCIGGMISGVGGLHYVMTYAQGNWTSNILGQLGWLSVALVIFATWKPHVGLLGSIIFGGLYVLVEHLPGDISSSTLELLSMLPYVVTIVVLIVTSIRNKKEDQPPAHLGQSYFREER